MKRFEQILCLVLFVSFPQFAQDIPNSGFENWIDENTPESWQTNNIPSAWISVSRSSESYAGSYAARVEIDDYNGFPIYPVLTVTFPVNDYSQTLTGYYQFYPVDNEVVLSVYTFYLKDGSLLPGWKHLDISSGASSYTQFNFDPSSSNSDTTPDSLWIQIEMVSSSNTGIGSYALIDQLSLGGTSDVKQINQNPTVYSLQQNYPNPFNPSTAIEFSIPEESFVELKVFDVLGNEVATLANDTYAGGNYRTDFNGDNLPSGIYIARMNAGSFTKSFKMMLLK